MAYVRGETLAARVERSGPLPPAEVARILRDAAWARELKQAVATLVPRLNLLLGAGVAPVSIGSSEVNTGTRFDLSQKLPFPGKLRHHFHRLMYRVHGRLKALRGATHSARLSPRRPKLSRA